MKNIVFFITLLSLGAGALIVYIPPTLAVNYPAQNGNNRKVVNVKMPIQKVGVGKTLVEAKMTSCLARQAAIKNQMATLINLTTKMENQFDTIAQRAVDYYNTSVVPSGKSVGNYDALITDIQTRKETIQAAVAMAQSDSNNFSCTANDPKLMMNQFRLNMQLVKVDLKGYRTSIRNLITAIHSVSPESVNNVQNNQ